MTPLLPIAAATWAICSGVTLSSNCPMADCAVCAPSSLAVGYTLGTCARGKSGTVELKPNASACARRAASPRSMPSLANAVLQEIVRAWMSVSVSPSPQRSPAKFGRTVRLCGSGSASGAAMRSSSWWPAVRAAAAVISLNVEPGGYVSWAARLSSGLSGSVLSAWAALLAVVSLWLASCVGS